MYKDLSSANYSLYGFLKEKSYSIIAECKQASPSAGIINKEYDPIKIAQIYQNCGASAISVLTDSQFFKGSLVDLKGVSEQVSLPVIRKDFIIDEKQIFEARHFGASAILLIVRILSQSQLKDFIQISSSLKMDTLVEVHTEEEATIALENGAKIIGINTRDLNTFQIHPELVPKISKLLPNSVHKVGESGIQSREDFWDMVRFVDSVLIGTYFMKAPNIESAFRELIQPQ